MRNAERIVEAVLKEQTTYTFVARLLTMVEEAREAAKQVVTAYEREGSRAVGMKRYAQQIEADLNTVAKDVFKLRERELY